MKTENWLQFPAVSCSPTGAKHNIHGAGGILNRSQGSGARGSHNSTARSSALKQKLSRRQHITALRRSSRPAPGPPRAWEASLLSRCALGCSAPGVLGRFPWGFSVFTWSEGGLEAGSRVSARGKKPKHLGARDRGDGRAASVPY